MADKEATIFILDVGSTMAQRHSGRSESDLDWSMRYVWDKITDIVAANRKTLYVGVVGLRTDETENKLSADDGYENISVLQELGSMSMTALRELQGKIGPSGTWSGDAISAIVVAVDMMETFTKKLKYNRKIFLVTDGQGAMDADDTSDIAKKINDIGISLTVLYVCFFVLLLFFSTCPMYRCGGQLGLTCYPGASILTIPNMGSKKRTRYPQRYGQY